MIGVPQEVLISRLCGTSNRERVAKAEGAIGWDFTKGEDSGHRSYTYI